MSGPIRFFLVLLSFVVLAKGIFAQQQNRDPQPLNLDEIRKGIRVPTYLLWGGYNSRLVCQLLVDENGNVAEVVIPGRVDFYLGWVVSRAMKSLRFVPAVLEGKTIKAWVTQPMFFTHSELVDVMPPQAPEPEDDAPFDFNSVKLLDRSGQYKNEVGEDAFRFPSVEAVWLQNNQIQSLPDKICEWKNLKLLCLQGNQLEALPACISQMKQLEYLFLGENPLKTDRAWLQQQLPNTVIVWEKAFENPPK